MINKLPHHYSYSTPFTVHDEEQGTVLELLGRHGGKINEIVNDQNVLRNETEEHLKKQDADIKNKFTEQDARLDKQEQEQIPNEVTDQINQTILSGAFNQQIDNYAGNLESRLDNLLGRVSPGSTSMDAEIVDVRTDMNGTTHPSAGASVRASDRALSERISFIENNIIFTVANLLEEITEGYYPVSNGTTPVIQVSTGYNTLKIKRPESGYLSCAFALSQNFTFLLRADGTIINTLAGATRLDRDGVIYKLPDECASILSGVSVSNSPNNYVFLNGVMDIATNKATVEEYPIGAPNMITIEKLFSKRYGDFFENLIGYAKYNAINGEVASGDLIATVNNLTQFSSASSIAISGDTATVNVTAVNGGVKTQEFSSASDSVHVTCEGMVSGDVQHIDYIVCYRMTDGTLKYPAASSVPVENKKYKCDFTFDASSMAVYNDASSFFILIRTPDNVTSGSFTVTNLKVWEDTNLQKLDVYADNFNDLMCNMYNKFTNQKATSENVLVSPDGTKFILSVSNNGTLSATPTTPDKSLFIGNSILLGMDNFYGMCASSPNDDYAHYVEAAIKQKKPNAVINKIHCAGYEQAVSDTDYNAWLNSAKSYLTSDLDLIVIQAGDNVNTDERKNYFASSIDNLLSTIKERCPKARIIWVSGWFGNARTKDIVSNACVRWGVNDVNIADLNIPANQGYSGQTYVTASGTTATVKDTWITHPGDTGMKLIADRIIKTMNM